MSLHSEQRFWTRHFATRSVSFAELVAAGGWRRQRRRRSIPVSGCSGPRPLAAVTRSSASSSSSSLFFFFTFYWNVDSRFRLSSFPFTLFLLSINDVSEHFLFPFLSDLSAQKGANKKEEKNVCWMVSSGLAGFAHD